VTERFTIQETSQKPWWYMGHDPNFPDTDEDPYTWVRPKEWAHWFDTREAAQQRIADHGGDDAVNPGWGKVVITSHTVTVARFTIQRVSDGQFVQRFHSLGQIDWTEDIAQTLDFSDDPENDLDETATAYVGKHAGEAVRAVVLPD
jgi:hypothetical protein